MTSVCFYSLMQKNCHSHDRRAITTKVVSSNSFHDDTTCDKVCQLLAAVRWFSQVSSINKTDRHDTTNISLKVVLSTITLTHHVVYLTGKQSIPVLFLIVFGLTRLGLKPRIYHTRGEQANHYTTDAVLCI